MVFKDRVVQYPQRFKMVPVAGTTDQFDFVPVPGEVAEIGTPVNSALLDYLGNTIQGIPISDVAPTLDTQFIGYDVASGKYKPKVVTDNTVNGIQYVGVPTANEQIYKFNSTTGKMEVGDMSVIKSIQRGSSSGLGNNSYPEAPVTITHSVVDLNKSFIMLDYNQFTLSSTFQGQTRLVSRTSTSFTVYASYQITGGNFFGIPFSWQLIEYK